jgi:hypothetical protein
LLSGGAEDLDANYDASSADVHNSECIAGHTQDHREAIDKALGKLDERVGIGDHCGIVCNKRELHRDESGGAA